MRVRVRLWVRERVSVRVFHRYGRGIPDETVTTGSDSNTDGSDTETAGADAVVLTLTMALLLVLVPV